MSGTRYDFTYINDFVRAFLEGTVDIVPFKQEMDEHEEIYDFLQDIIDDIKKKNGEIRPYPFPHPAIPGGVLMSTETIEYRETVDNGDTIWGICAKIATDDDNLQEMVDNVIRDNGIGMDCNIRPGQELVIRVERKHYFDFGN